MQVFFMKELSLNIKVKFTKFVDIIFITISNYVVLVLLWEVMFVSFLNNSDKINECRNNFDN